MIHRSQTALSGGLQEWGQVLNKTSKALGPNGVSATCLKASTDTQLWLDHYWTPCSLQTGQSKTVWSQGLQHCDSGPRASLGIWSSTILHQELTQLTVPPLWPVSSWPTSCLRQCGWDNQHLPSQHWRPLVVCRPLLLSCTPSPDSQVTLDGDWLICPLPVQGQEEGRYHLCRPFDPQTPTVSSRYVHAYPSRTCFCLNFDVLHFRFFLFDNASRIQPTSILRGSRGRGGPLRPFGQTALVGSCPNSPRLDRCMLQPALLPFPPVYFLAFCSFKCVKWKEQIKNDATNIYFSSELTWCDIWCVNLQIFKFVISTYMELLLIAHSHTSSPSSFLTWHCTNICLWDHFCAFHLSIYSNVLINCSVS